MAVAGTHQLRQRDFVHLADIKPRSSAHIAWERRRHRQAHWFVECFAEFVSAISLVPMASATRTLTRFVGRWASSSTSMPVSAVP